jgi:hypothetical protein
LKPCRNAKVKSLIRSKNDHWLRLINITLTLILPYNYVTVFNIFQSVTQFSHIIISGHFSDSNPLRD